MLIYVVQKMKYKLQIKISNNLLKNYVLDIVC